MLGTTNYPVGCGGRGVGVSILSIPGIASVLLEIIRRIFFEGDGVCLSDFSLFSFLE